MDANITQSFIDMVEAYKAKPGLEETIADLRQDVEFFERNLRIEEDTSRSLREANANLMAQLEGVKKERDDAMFRSLELEDKFSGIEKLLGVAERLEQARQAEHKATVDAMTPKPEPLDLSKAPIPNDPWYDPNQLGPIDPIVVEPQGQSESRPTEVYSTEASLEPNGTTSKDGPETQILSDDWDEYNPINYHGRPYSQKPWWVNASEWHDAGGLMD